MNRPIVHAFAISCLSTGLIACLSAKTATKEPTADAGTALDGGKDSSTTVGGGTSTDGAAATNDAGSTASAIYVVSNGTNALLSFPIGSSGNVAPTTVLTGAATGIATPLNVALDSQGNAYVASRTGAGVVVFPKGATGNVSPIRTLSAANMLSASGLALGEAGDIYVSTCPNCGTSSGGETGVWHFPSDGGASDWTLGGATNMNTLFTVPGSIGLDGIGNLYVGNAFGGAIEVFAETATGDVAPAFSFSIAGANVQSIAYGAGTVFATVPGVGIEEFSVVALADAGLADGGLPDASQTISFTSLGVSYPGAMFVDVRGATPTLYLVDYGGDAVYIIPTTGSPGDWTAGAVSSIAGANTQISQPYGIALSY